MIHLDCTLRDGGYQNGWNFSKQFINDYINLMNLLKLDVIELGIKSNIRNGKFGPLSRCNEIDLHALPNSPLVYSVLVNIAEFIEQDMQCFRNLFPVSVEKCRYKVVRMAGTLETVQRCQPHIEYLKSFGYTVCLNVMRVSTIEVSRLSDLGEALNHIGCDVLYIADSFGNLTPTSTSKIMRALKAVTDMLIGVHMHDNQGLALQNTLTANEHGASWLDSTMMGMGRGAGNVATEKFLLSTGYETQVQDQVEFIIKHIQPIFTHSPWGPSLDFYYAGLWNLHPNYVTKMRDYKLSIEKILAVLLRLKSVGGQKYLPQKLDAII